MRALRHRRRLGSGYLRGPSLIGFFGLSEADHGDPRTPLPLVTITPSVVDGHVLPFRCPRCKKVNRRFGDPSYREKYHDTRTETLDGRRFRRDNYWCPACGFRFKLDLAGQAVTRLLPPETVAPSTVVRTLPSGEVLRERQDDTTLSTVLGWFFRGHQTGVDVLGACA